jgi:hypothetical protein
LCIGQLQVEHDNVDRMRLQMLLGLTHALDVRRFGAARALLVGHFAQQTGVCGVGYDQELYFARFLAHRLYLRCGDLIFAGLKLLMHFMGLANASNCTGLVQMAGEGPMA